MREFLAALAIAAVLATGVPARGADAAERGEQRRIEAAVGMSVPFVAGSAPAAIVKQENAFSGSCSAVG